MFRHDDEAASARRIVTHLVRNCKYKGPLALQCELVDQKLQLRRTTAGRVVLSETARRAAEAKKEIAALDAALRQRQSQNTEELREMKVENERVVMAAEKMVRDGKIRVQDMAAREQKLMVGRSETLSLVSGTNF